MVVVHQGMLPRDHICSLFVMFIDMYIQEIVECCWEVFYLQVRRASIGIAGTRGIDRIIALLNKLPTLDSGIEPTTVRDNG